MFQKNTIYDTEEAHNEIGQAIHDAKRRFLDAHKKGVPLNDAAETFFAECRNVIDCAAIRLQSPAPKDAQSTNIKEIETLTKASLQDGEHEQHLALLRLISLIADDPSWAMWARHAIITHSKQMTDLAAHLLVRKGGDA